MESNVPVFKTPNPRPSTSSSAAISRPCTSSSLAISRPGTSASAAISSTSWRPSTGPSSTRKSETGTTPTSTRTLIEPLDRQTILAVVEGRGQARGEIGIACMNIKTPTLILCQFTDTLSYLRVISKVNLFRPYEILMPATACDASNPSQLCVQLKKEVSNVTIVPIQRRIFNEAKGLQKINSLVADQYTPVVHSITNKYYCLAAAASLLKYAELVQSIIFATRSLKIEFQGSEQTCMIDHVTSQHLELLQNNKNPTSLHSLLGILNSCRTPVGTRLLRMSILQPFCDEEQINSRLDSIEVLMKDREILFGLQDILTRLPVDVEHVIATLIQIPKVDHARVTEQRINNIIALKHTLELVPNFVTLLENSQDKYFQSVTADLKMPAYEVMLDKIKRVIHDEAQFQKGVVNMKRQRCFAVKADVNPILDIARKAYCEIIADINNYVIELSHQMNLSLRLGTSNQRGFFIQFTIPGRSEEIPPLPSHFLQVKRRGKVVTFTTEVLISSDHRAQEIMKEIENLSSIVISELISSIRSEIGILFKVSEAIANLDVINSLANYALSNPRTVRPSFLPSVTSITMGRHPILESISVDPTIPNNVFLSKDVNFMLITGPNMSGKTTYIKQMACLQVLAQIGSYVPAEAASFRIMKNILSRIGTGDSVEENASSFALEITEMTFILQNICDHSLIIIDELGRATSVEEGAAISWAIAEELLKTNAFVLFATHHLFLTRMESYYLNVLNFTMETLEWKDGSANHDLSKPLSRLRYNHVIRRGVTQVENYGLKLAMNTCFPSNVITNAVDIANSIINSRKTDEKSAENKEITTRRNKYLLGTHLNLMANRSPSSDIDIDDLRQCLECLQLELRPTTCMNDGVQTSR